MNCSACGTDNREGARFCRMCGKELQQASAVESPAVPGAEVANEADLAAVEAVEPPDGGAAVEAVEPPDSGAAPTPPGPEAEASAATPVPVAEVQPGNTVTAETPLEAEPDDKSAEAEGVPVEAPELAGPAAPTAAGEPAAVAEENPPTSEGAPGALALSPAPPGTVIAGRFLILEPLSVEAEQILYRARDLQQCRQCQSEGNVPGEAYCARCGAVLEPAEVRLLEERRERPEPVEGTGVRAQFAVDDRRFYLVEPQEVQPAATPAAASVHLIVGQRSDTGRMRELDEDSLIVLSLLPNYEAKPGPLLSLLAVADGMGGHEGGEVASRLTLELLTDTVVRTIVLPEINNQPALPETITSRLREAVIAANDAVYLARQKRENDMGSTLTVALIRNEQLFLAHVGDCRAYRWNAAGLEQLTTDHSLVASLIASGQVKPEELYTHPHRSVIYRCIGDKPVVEVDTAVLSLTAGDRILLCSDGLWEMVREEGIRDVLMQESNPQAACDLLVKNANTAGGEDNISIIIAQVEVR